MFKYEASRVHPEKVKGPFARVTLHVEIVILVYVINS